MTSTAIVTGASSFVGCHLACAFAGAGYSVTATHSKPRDAYSEISATRLDTVATHASLIQLDITDATAIRTLVDRLHPDLWVHHAGYTTDYASPVYDRIKGDAINVAPLDAIYDAMAETSGGVLITGTNAEYADGDDANREDDKALPTTAYGQSKLAETRRAQELAERHGVPTRVGRLYIPFGRLDNPAKLLASTQTALSEGQAIDLSACTQRRDFLGVGDVCSAWLKMVGDLPRTKFDIFNICSGKATELRSLLLSIADAMGADHDMLRFGQRPMRPGEPAISFGDNTKARRLLDWRPRSLATAIQEELLAVDAP